MYIYRVTNEITDEFYIGKRSNYSGDVFTDEYYGSGLVVNKLWLKKKIPVKKEILLKFTGTDLSERFLNQIEGLLIRRWYKDNLCVNINKGAKPEWEFFDNFLPDVDVLVHENIKALWGVRFHELLHELRERPILYHF